MQNFFKAKTKECDQITLFFSDNFGTFMHYLAIFFLKVRARVSLKVATKGCFRAVKT